MKAFAQAVHSNTKQGRIQPVSLGGRFQ